MTAREKISGNIKELTARRAKASEISPEFWRLARENYEDLADLLLDAEPWVLTELIDAGLAQADADLILLAEKHEWLRERVGRLISSLSRERLDLISDGLLREGLERSAVGRRIFYRLRPRDPSH